MKNLPYVIKMKTIEIYGLGATSLTLEEIKLVLSCRLKSDYKPMVSTDLYINRSAIYCALLQAIAYICK